MTELFYTSVGTVSLGHSAQSALWQRLPEWQQRRLLRYRDSAARELSLTAWALLEVTLSRCVGVGLLRTLECGQYGKPFLRGGPHFNLSHCAGLAVCALSDSPVGVDVERTDALPRLEDVWAWTRKESVGKYLGLGLVPPLQADAPQPLWTGELNGGYLASICPCSTPIITQWNEEVLWKTHTNYPVR